jgi:hypothetical protein
MLARNNGMLLKENMGKNVLASTLLEELQKADGPPLIRANIDAQTVCEKRSNLKKKFSIMVKNGGCTSTGSDSTIAARLSSMHVGFLFNICIFMYFNCQSLLWSFSVTLS